MKYFVLTIVCIAFWLDSASSQVVVVAHKSVPVDSLSKSELLNLYTGETSVWDDGEPVVIFDLKEKGSTRKTFYDFLGMASSRIKSIWLKRMLSGESDPPVALKSEDEVLQKISSTTGAIGFLNHSKPGGQVKVLMIGFSQLP